MQNKNIVNLEMFHGVNNFNGINHENLVVEGDGDVYVPFVIKQLWFRSVFPKGRIQTKIVGSLEEAIRYKLCVFNAEIYDHDGSLLSGGYGSANATEDNFIEIAERRAVGRALANAGFTWHTGDFSQNNNQEIDVVQSYLQIYNSYINMGVFDTTDVKVIQLYEDAVVTVLPNGYGENSGKPIMAMSENHMSEIAKNYGLINDGEPLINAKIKFVSMYNFFQSMSEKSEISNISTDIIPEVQKATPVADAIPEVQKATPVADAIPEVLQATPVADAVPEVLQDAPVADAIPEVLQATPVADAIPEVQKATPVADAIPEVLQATPVADAVPEVLQDAPVADAIPEVLQATPVADAIPEVQKATPVADAIPEVLQATPVADAVPEVLQDAPVADAIPEVLQATPVADAVPEVQKATPVADAVPEVLQDAPVADAVPEVQKATPVADAVPEVLQDAPVADAVPEVLQDAPVADAVPEVLQDAPVADAVPGNTSDFDIDDIFKVQEEKSDVEKETLKKVLARWGYTQEKELIENWKKHLEKIKETSKKVDWTNFVQAKTYIENIPIYKNFLWSEHAKKDEIVLLGDVLNQYKDETIAIVENGTFPLFTLLYAVKWYIHYVWKCTQV